MTTPDLNNLRDQIRTGRAGPRTITGAPPPVDVPVTPAPAPVSTSVPVPPPPLSIVQRIETWLDDDAAAFKEKAATIGAVIGILFGLYKVSQPAGSGNYFGAIIVGALGGSVITTMALTLVFFVARAILERLVPIAIFAGLALVAVLVRACSS
jgi:hypothetical protein